MCSPQEISFKLVILLMVVIMSNQKDLVWGIREINKALDIMQDVVDVWDLKDASGTALSDLAAVHDIVQAIRGPISGSLDRKLKNLRGVKLSSLKMARHGWKNTLALVERYVRDPTEEGQAELSDYAVNVLRQEGRRHFGYDGSDLLDLARDEISRVRGLKPIWVDLVKYLKMSRSGAKYRMNRDMRAALFAQFVAKGLI